MNSEYQTPHPDPHIWYILTYELALWELSSYRYFFNEVANTCSFDRGEESQDILAILLESPYMYVDKFNWIIEFQNGIFHKIRTNQS